MIALAGLPKVGRRKELLGSLVGTHLVDEQREVFSLAFLEIANLYLVVACGEFYVTIIFLEVGS